MKIKKLLKIIFVFVLITNAYTADFSSNVKQLMGDNAKAYAMPVIKGFGTSLNTGLYKKASVEAGKLIPVGLDVGIVSMLAMVPDGKTTFSHNLADFKINFNIGDEYGDLENLEISFADIYNANSTTTPNIAGDGDGVTCNKKDDQDIYNNIRAKMQEQGVNPETIDARESDIKNYISQYLGDEYSSFSFPGGLGLKTLGALALQGNVRLPLVGMEVTARYLPSLKLSKDLGKFDMYGIGLRKSVPVPIIDLTAGIFLQKMQLGDFFELNTRMLHLEVGKSIGIPFLFSFSPYAGVGFSQTNAALNYQVDTDEIPGIERGTELSYDIDAEDDVVLTLGATAQLIPLTYLNLEVNQGEYTSACLKFGLIIK